ncbi:MAG: hypothetical protein AAF804_13510 [Bacteroidota bacterium]
MLVLIFVLSLSSGQAQQAESVPGLFDSEEVLELTIRADFASFLADRTGTAKAVKAQISYPTLDGSEVDVPLKIKVRGRFRRDPMVCDFPPIRLDFDKDDDLPPPFQNQNKLKVVTHCQYEEYIFREYYLYKVFQLLSEYSFQVRLCRISYVDINQARETETKWAFLIEAEDELAKRFGGEPLDEEVNVTPDDVEREQLTLVHMFNYMAANRDFDVRIRQNVKVISRAEGRPVVVPYDFDWSGMINAEYTKSYTQAGGPVYKDRVRFVRLCRTEEEYEAVLDQFQAIKGDIFELYQTSPYLSKEVVKETLGYYKTFYKTSKKAKTMEEVFLKGCR